jgi:hypothetical protein
MIFICHETSRSVPTAFGWERRLSCKSNAVNNKPKYGCRSAGFWLIITLKILVSRVINPHFNHETCENRFSIAICSPHVLMVEYNDVVSRDVFATTKRLGVISEPMRVLALKALARLC